MAAGAREKEPDGTKPASINSTGATAQTSKGGGGLPEGNSRHEANGGSKGGSSGEWLRASTKIGP